MSRSHLCLAAPVAALFSACTGSIAGDSAPGEGPPVPGDSSPSAPPGPAVSGATSGPTAMPQAGAAVESSRLFTCNGARPASAPRIWRLSAAQYDATVRTLAPALTKDRFSSPFSGVESSLRFSNYAESFGMPAPVFDRALSSAEAIAARLASVLTAETPCLAAPDPTCLRAAFGKVGARAFRRPLAADEVERYATLVTGLQASVGGPSALRHGLQAMLASPHFLFRIERGDTLPDGSGRRRLSAWELSSALSYTLTDAPPDDILNRSAAAGTLLAPEELRAQVTRLLGETSDNQVVRRFFREYFHYENTANVFKDAKLFPFHSSSALLADTEAWLKEVVKARKDTLKTLLTADWGFVGPKSAPSYNLETLAPRAAQRVTFPAGQRAGMLTQPSFLTAFSLADENDPIVRGKFIAQSLLCLGLPDAPPTAVPPLPENPKATVRERLSVHVNSAPGCRACHDIMDDLGLGLEGFDHVGRFRTTDGGKPTNSRGVIRATGTAADGAFDGAVELGVRLAAAPVVEQCFLRHGFRYLLGRDETAADACSMVSVKDAWRRSGGDFGEAVAALVTSESFLFRTNASP